MMWIFQAVLDAILVYLVLRLWRERKQAAALVRQPDEGAAALVPTLEQYRGELSDLLDCIEITVRKERESLTEAVKAARAEAGLDKSGPRRKEEKGGHPSQPTDVVPLRESVRALADKDVPRERIAASLGLGVREVELLLSLSVGGNRPSEAHAEERQDMEETSALTPMSSTSHHE
jgi:hypothetical protein